MRDKPKIELYRTQKDGKPAIELVVRNSLYDKAFHDLIDALGYKPTVYIANRRSIICTSDAEVDAARNPIASYFDAGGNWKEADHE